MLTALLDQSSMSAGQLAFAANVSPQTASFHLARLTSAALLTGERQGRNQVYRLSGAAVASAIESLAAISALRRTVRYADDRFRSERLQQLRMARTCYDHLAGRTAVLLHDSLLKSGCLVQSGGKEYTLTVKGGDWFEALGLNPDLSRTRPPFARSCLDWSERRPHLAGRLGTLLLGMFFKDAWIVKVRDTRAVRITELGFREFERHYGLNLERPGKRL